MDDHLSYCLDGSAIGSHPATAPVALGGAGDAPASADAAVRRERVDMHAVWRQMPVEQQERIGVWAMAMMLGIIGEHHHLAPEQGFVAAAFHGHVALEGEIHALFSRPGGLAALPMPSLSGLGIRSCAQCGCTDACGCENGCWWLQGDVDLCSACGLPARRRAGP